MKVLPMSKNMNKKKTIKNSGLQLQLNQVSARNYKNSCCPKKIPINLLFLNLLLYKLRRSSFRDFQACLIAELRALTLRNRGLLSKLLKRYTSQ